MKAEIESIVCNWADEIPHIFIRVINAITLSANEEELRTAVKRIAEETELDKFFAYGYGAHHFWLTHRRLSNGEPKEYRLLKVEFWEYEEENLQSADTIRLRGSFWGGCREQRGCTAEGHSGLRNGDGRKCSQHPSRWGNQLGFLHAPRCKDGTDNRSRKADRVMRSADLPTAPFFRELRAEKERNKETPMKSTSLLLTVSWDGSKVTKSHLE